jgi:phosphatidylcholine synthase
LRDSRQTYFVGGFSRRRRLASSREIGNGWVGNKEQGLAARPMSIFYAWAVHLLTVSGAGLALVAAVAAARGAWQTAFLCLGIAFIVDGLDGPLARRARVGERIPWFDGSALDFIIDYANYVFIPAYIVAESGLISEPLATICGVAIVVVGALYFGDKRMKTDNYGFRGFPSVWNAVVYLMMVYRPSEAVSILLIAGFAILTFVPIEFVHPVRVVRLRPLTLGVTFGWAILSVLVLIENLQPGPVVAAAFLAASAYLAVIGAILQLSRRLR